MMVDIFFFLPKPAASSDLVEAHPYGPAPAPDPNNPDAGEPGFHFDLAIEFSPQAFAEANVLAVVSGHARILLDPVVNGLCSLVLLPTHTVLRALRGVLGGGNVAFVYRNIIAPAPSPAPITDAWVRIPLDSYGQGIRLLTLPQPELTEQQRQLLAGEIAVDVVAGQPLGRASMLGGHNGWTRMGFEIAFIPNGAGDNLSWPRLKELLAPSNARTRRLDPVSFYHSIMFAGPEVQLAPEHTGHPLLSIWTQRVLIEVRDEYDDPFAGSVQIAKAGDAPVSYSLGVEEFGTVAVDQGTGDYSVSVSRRVMTNLPSGDSAVEQPNKTLSAPAHWALQALEMFDGDSPNNWFVINAPPFRQFWPGNLVVPIRDGAEVFRGYASVIENLLQAGQYMYLAGWILMDDFILGDSGLTMFELIQRAAVNGVTVRVLLWKQQVLLGTPPNELEAARINALANDGYDVEAVRDDHTHNCTSILRTGTHHQKFLLVRRSSGHEIAFCGGVDLNQNRRDSDNHGALAGYHDVHAMLDGPAVADVHRAFVDRWTSHPGRRSVSALADNATTDQGSVWVQVACTYPLVSSNPYPFASTGSTTPLRAFVRAIEKAKKFIYIEDQYLSPYTGSQAADTVGSLNDDSLGVLTALRDALLRIDYLIMVIPNHVSLGWLQKLWGQHPGQARYRRSQFIKGLMAVAPEKVHVYYLARRTRHPGPPGSGEDATDVGDGQGTSGSPDHPDEIYCHSKVWIVDDVCMKIGSANCNSRSYTHDSEMDLIMVDGAVSNGARTLAQSFRRELWGEHLGLPWPDQSVLDDHMIALQYWLPQRRPFEARIRDYIHDDTEGELGNTGWTNFIDPDGR